MMSSLDAAWPFLKGYLAAVRCHRYVFVYPPGEGEKQHEKVAESRTRSRFTCRCTCKVHTDTHNGDGGLSQQ